MIQYNLYKGVSGKFGALQFSLKRPDISGDSLDNWKPGVIFVNACSPSGKNEYDWSKKFVFALGLTDIGKIIHFFVTAGERESLSLVHDPNKGTDKEGTIAKSMGFFTSDGCANGCMVTCSTKEGDNVISHKIPMSGDEVIVLKNLLEAAIPSILGWNIHE